MNAKKWNRPKKDKKFTIRDGARRLKGGGWSDYVKQGGFKYEKMAMRKQSTGKNSPSSKGAESEA